MNFVKYIKSHGIRRTFQVIYRYKIDKYLQNILLSITKNRVLPNTIVIESHNDFDSNGGAFFNYLLDNGYNKKYKIVWLLKNKKAQGLPKNVKQFYLYKPSLLKDYYITNAKYILTCQNAIGSVKKGQLSIYLTHGPVCLKAFKGKVMLPDNLDYCLMPSKYLTPILKDQYSLIGQTKTVELGYPAHDVFYSDTPGDLNKVTKKKFKKVILWMPTFRKGKAFGRNDSTETLPLGIPILTDNKMVNNLNEVLKKENALLIIKIHPMQDINTVKISSLSNIIVLDGNTVKKKKVDNYRLMKDVDALVSDYSSAAYDFLHLDRPIGFTMDDIDSYKLGFIVSDPQKLIGGRIINNYHDFLSFVNSVLEERDPYKVKRQKIFNKVFDFHDGNSSKRLVDFMNL